MSYSFTVRASDKSAAKQAVEADFNKVASASLPARPTRGPLIPPLPAPARQLAAVADQSRIAGQACERAYDSLTKD